MRNTSCFSEESFAKLRGIMTDLTIPAGANLFWEDDKADKFHYIHQGSLKVSKSNNEGKEFVLYLYRAGDMMGRMDGNGFSKQIFNAYAVEDCMIGVIDNVDLELLLWQNGELAIEFMKWMSLSHRTTQTKFRDLMLYGKPGALCSSLIRMANSFGIPGDNGTTTIGIKLTNAEIADYIGAARESVNRMLGDLKKAGAIAIEGGYITLTDIDYLRSVCHCELCPKEICRM